MLKHWEKMFVMPFPSSMLSLGQTQLHNLLEGGEDSLENMASSTRYDRYVHKIVIIDMSETDTLVLERFVCLMYDRGSTFTNVNDCRRYLFTKMSGSIENCQPTSNVLVNHVKRAQLQSSIWTSTLISDSESIDPLKWGWQKRRIF